MIFSLEEIKNDILVLSLKEIYNKYIMSNDNWYFENVLSVSLRDCSLMEIAERFNEIICATFSLPAQNIVMVGSGKLGYSLTPPKRHTAKKRPEEPQKTGLEEKLFQPFCIDGKERKISDLDIALISEKLFEDFWYLLRISYRGKYQAFYNYIPMAIYRGYINEQSLLAIDGCRKNWYSISSTSKKVLHSDLFVQHDINYRLYRNWYDFEDYHLQALKSIKRGIVDGTIIS